VRLPIFTKIGAFLKIQKIFVYQKAPEIGVRGIENPSACTAIYAHSLMSWNGAAKMGAL